ncbi:MAG: TIGR03435 family protein [Bryobacteraceae bacterium]
MVLFNRVFQSILGAAVTGCIAFGLAQAPQSQEHPAFEVASIKPAKSGTPFVGIRSVPGSGRFTASNVSIRMLITMAYKLQPFQLEGGPAWLASDRYDIEATPERTGNDDSAKQQHVDFEQQFEQQRLRIQALLEDRCKLKFHRETRELPIYALVVAKNGPKLKPSEQKKHAPMMGIGRGRLEGQGVKLSFLADALSHQLDRTVLDKTGLTGNYDIKLEYTPDQSQGGPGFGGPPGEGPGPGAGPGPGPMGKDTPAPPDSNGPSIFTALQEQLGLKLESQKGPVEILVIDHVEKPSEN